MHRWLQPAVHCATNYGKRFLTVLRKPLKRFVEQPMAQITALKCGVNETDSSLGRFFKLGLAAANLAIESRSVDIVAKPAIGI